MLPMVPLETAPTLPFEVVIALVALYGATLTAYIGTVAFFAWRLGRVPTRQEYTELRNELRADNAQIRDELKAEIAQLREEVKTELAQFREDFRRSHQQIMLALVNHSHRDDGQVVFTLPPELEPTTLPADD